MTLKNLLVVSMVTAGCALARSGYADLVDTMDSTINFTGAFNGETATANGDGTVTLLRTVASVDAGINWNRQGSFLSIANEGRLTLTPVAPVNGGFFNANILLFNSSGGFLAESQWLGDTQSTSVQSLDVGQFAATLAQSNPAVAAATQYEVRFRMDPFGTAGAGFTYTELSAVAVPEPASAWLLLAGLPLLRARRRAGQGN